MKKRTVQILKWSGISVIAVSCVYGLAVGMTTLKLRNVMRQLKEDGRPLRKEEILPGPVPESENAALLYQAVILILKSEPGNGDSAFAELNQLASEWKAEERSSEFKQEFKTLLNQKRVQEALILLAHATTREFCVFDLDYTLGVSLELPHIMDLMSLSRILCARAELKLSQGDAQGAWEDALTAVRFANALRDEPILISQLVRIQMFMNAAELVQPIMLHASPDAGQREELEQLLTSFEDLTPYIRSLDGERLLLGEWVLSLPRDELRKTSVLGGVNSQFTLSMVTSLTPLMRYDQAKYMEVMNAFVRFAEEGAPVSPEAYEQELLSDVPFICIFTRMLVPSLSSIQDAYTEMVATARVIQAGVLLSDHTRKTGMVPQELKGPNTLTLTDPFSGEPLRYRPRPDGFVLYSIGQNRTDDAGQVSKASREGDIVWSFELENGTSPEL